MTHEPTIYAFYESFGGGFSPFKGEHKTVWCWSLSGEAAGRFAHLILPFSITKKPELQLALLFLDVVDNLSIIEREEFYLHMRDLKRYEYRDLDDYKLLSDLKFEEAMEE